MTVSPTVLGLITARGGSKGLPRKNVLPLAGKPLIAWTIEAALGSTYIDRVILSTDDDEIIAVAQAHGCDVPFRRPAELARDDTPSVAPVLHALDEESGFDLVVLLQPTSPLRRSEDIDGVIAMCLQADAPSCVSVTAVDKPPEWMFYLERDRTMRPVLPRPQLATRRQEVAPAYALNGAVYVSRVEALRESGQFITDETVAYEMPPDRSADIDTELDFRWCELLLSRSATEAGRL